VHIDTAAEISADEQGNTAKVLTTIGHNEVKWSKATESKHEQDASHWHGGPSYIDNPSILALTNDSDARDLDGVVDESERHDLINPHGNILRYTMPASTDIVARDRLIPIAKTSHVFAMTEVATDFLSSASTSATTDGKHQTPWEQIVAKTTPIVLSSLSISYLVLSHSGKQLVGAVSSTISDWICPSRVSSSREIRYRNMIIEDHKRRPTIETPETSEHKAPSD